MNETSAAALDEILKLLMSAELKGMVEIRDRETIDKFIETQSKKGININSSQFNRMLEYLKKEDLVYINDAIPPALQITLKGMDWISSEIGGFTQQRIDKISERKRLVTFDKRMEIATIILAIGTVGLVLVELLIHYKEILRNLCGC